MEYAIIFGIGLAASFFGSFMSGGLSLIAISALYLMGLPSHVVLSTFRIGAFGFDLGGFLQYQRAGKIVWSLFVPLTIFGLLGSIIGASLVLSADEMLISRVVGFAMLLFIPLALFRPKLGIEQQEVSRVRRWLGHVGTFFVSIWSGSFMVGSGYFSVFKMMYFYGLTLLQAKASGKFPILISDIVIIYMFAQGGIVNWAYGGALLIGMFSGALLGTHFAIKVGDAWLRTILLVTILLVAIKLIAGL